VPFSVRRAIAAKTAAWRLRRINPCTATRAQYTASANAAKTALFKFRRQQEEQVLESRNLKQFYKHVNKRLNPHPKPIKLILPNEEITQCSEQISSMFNTFFLVFLL
jgi:hypothetical protein